MSHTKYENLSTIITLQTRAIFHTKCKLSKPKLGVYILFLIDVLDGAFGRILLDRVPYSLIEISCMYCFCYGIDDDMQSGNGSGAHRLEKTEIPGR